MNIYCIIKEEIIKESKEGVHSFFNKLIRLKIIPDKDVPMALLF